MSCCTKTGNGVIGYADSRGEWSLYLYLVVRACPILAVRTFIFSVCRLLKQTNADLNGLMFWRLMRDGWMFTGFIVHDARLRFRHGVYFLISFLFAKVGEVLDYFTLLSGEKGDRLTSIRMRSV